MIKGYDNLGFLTDQYGNLIDVEKGGLENLIDKTQPLKTPETKKTPPLKTPETKEIPPQKTKEIPKEYLNKDWEELYREEKLFKIQNEFPSLYEKLRKEKYNF